VFLQNVRYTLIPALVVPVAILGAFAVMQVLGMSVNVLTMFAMVLAIGILVDDAIVVVENVERIMVEDGLSPKEATKKAMPQISGAIVGITLVLSAVFLPLAFMAGSVGVIYRQFSVAMAVSIAFSGFLALTFTPALCATLLKPIPKGHHETKRGFFGWFNRVFTRTTNGYESFIGKTLRRGGRMMFIYLIMVLVLGFLYMRMPTAFLPEEDQGYVIANIELPAGSTANRTIETISKVEDYFKEQPQVENIIAVQGFSFNGSGLNSAIAFVPLKDFNERKGQENSAQAISGKAMGQLLFGLPDSMVIAIVPPAISALGNSSCNLAASPNRRGLVLKSLRITTKKVGTIKTANGVAANIPPSTPRPTAFWLAAPAPVEVAKGTTPSTKAKDVIRIGRKRRRAASRVASTKVAPRA
jgi:multidrug efflux pump